MNDSYFTLVGLFFLAGGMGILYLTYNERHTLDLFQIRTFAGIGIAAILMALLFFYWSI